MQELLDKIQKIKEAMTDLSTDLGKMEQSMQSITSGVVSVEPSPFIIGLTIFALACFVGYYVVWRVTPALHSPLMAITNAVSSVIIIGALLTAHELVSDWGRIWGFLAVFLASINIFGGFVITQRMLSMFSGGSQSKNKGE